MPAARPRYVLSCPMFIIIFEINFPVPPLSLSLLPEPTRRVALDPSPFTPGTGAVPRSSWLYGRCHVTSTCSIAPKEQAELDPLLLIYYIHLYFFFMCAIIQNQSSLTKVHDIYKSYFILSLSLQSPHVQMNGTDILRQLNKLHASNISPSSSQSSLSVESARSNPMQGSCHMALT